MDIHFALLMHLIVLSPPFPFQNKCNVGYAFINMIDPQHIIPFYQVWLTTSRHIEENNKIESYVFGHIPNNAGIIILSMLKYYSCFI